MAALLEAHVEKYSDGVMVFEDRPDWAKLIPSGGDTVKPSKAAAAVGFPAGAGTGAGAGAADTTESGSVGPSKTKKCCVS